MVTKKKIVAKSNEGDEDGTELLEKLRNFKVESPRSIQKGIRDIDPEKLAEARKPRVYVEYSEEDDESDCDNGNELSGDEDESSIPYGESLVDAKKRLKNK